MFLINGQFSEALSVQDRGLHYGDGVFETIAIQQQLPLCWNKHYTRLKSGCTRLGMECPPSDLLFSEAMQIYSDAESCVLKIILTRGQGGRGYRSPDKRSSLTRILATYPWPDFPAENSIAGVKTRFCKTRLGYNPQLAGIKHLNRLEQVIARSEWDEPDIDEGIMRDTRNNIIEGTMSNLFIINDNKLKTPDLAGCGIAGVIRDCILAIADEIGLHTSITIMTEPELLTADEVFLCNSIIGIWPVRQIEHHTINQGPWADKIRRKLIQEKIIIQ